MCCLELVFFVLVRTEQQPRREANIDRKCSSALLQNELWLVLQAGYWETFLLWVVMNWHRQPRGVVGSPPLGVFKKWGAVTLYDIVGNTGNQWMVRLGVLRGFFHPQ